jgi:hypothetical protein
MMRKRALGELEPFFDFAVAESWKLFQLFARGWVDRRDWQSVLYIAFRLDEIGSDGSPSRLRRARRSRATTSGLQPQAIRNQNAIE